MAPQPPYRAPATAASSMPQTSHRGYESLYTIRYKGAQRDRFPGQSSAIMNELLGIQDDLGGNHHSWAPYPENFTGLWEHFPHVSRWRKNLTALSQHYNLYFVAYRSYIHVYKPNADGRNTMGEPLIVLDPEQSKSPMAAFTSGHINPDCPDEINDMSVGELGDKEILVAVRDNGDVNAWYIDTIAQDARSAIAKNPNGEPATFTDRLPSSKHFFTNNVGASAWGIAIHKKSRLIAIASNTKEITIFAFAIDDQGPGTQDAFLPTHVECASDAKAEYVEDPFDGSCTYAQVSMNLLKAKKLPLLQQRFRTRQRTWRIMIPLGNQASNIPSLTFCEAVDGNADRIAAIDILGCLYIADIWKVGTRPVRIPVHNVPQPTLAPINPHHHPAIQGWNILAVTDAQLLPTDSYRSAMGVQAHHMVYRGATTRGAWTDISKCMAEVSHNAAHEIHERHSRKYIIHDASRATDGPWNGTRECDAQYLHLSDRICNTSFPQEENLGMTMIPYSGEHWPESSNPRSIFDCADFAAAGRRKAGLPRSWTLDEFRDKRGGEASVAHLLRGVSFLRANTEDIEMLSLRDRQDDSGMVCHHVLTKYMSVRGGRTQIPGDMAFGERCSMLLTIPELHMVIIGSMSGRVALLTLTRPPESQRQAPQQESNHMTSSARHFRQRPVPRRAFRVDAVLPFKAEEALRHRPLVCLLGIAVSPVPETAHPGLGLRRGQGRRYRGASSTTNGTTKEGIRKTDTGPDPNPPSRWRLILHYMNHDILQYEISRRPTNEMNVPESATAWEKRSWRKEFEVSCFDNDGKACSRDHSMSYRSREMDQNIPQGDSELGEHVDIEDEEEDDEEDENEEEEGE
ncbi:hypothetical protein BD289DRAFT_478469 [Coniella lustricola]|uniref:Uncharacterized protein n=1 Tax=Coniella lustricola TaxID=2025994 RepID=A0A2T3AMJ9_9PEZI|nr:hypothetical protein BD289DRAFT_478469 [Coniella lustricola]